MVQYIPLRSLQHASYYRSFSKLLIDLYFAAKSGNSEVIQEFLAHSFPVDIQNQADFTALIMASYYEHAEVVSSLLAHQANHCLGNISLNGYHSKS